jgi:7-cyano-7-deazaguanine synthase
MTMRRAVVLLSGGMDSATTAAIAREDGFAVQALSFRYGQRHVLELEAAQRVAASLGVERHVIIDIDLRAFGGSALTDSIDVPKDRSVKQMGADVPVTYVPARNTIFLAFGLAWAETLDTADIFIGANAVDYSGYPDCRPEFLQAFEAMSRLGTKMGTSGRAISIHSPLIAMTKGEIIERGRALGVDFSLTRSCYDPDAAGNACGRCDACQLRLKGYASLGLRDPAPYVEALAR